jgi:hypothetical protein
MPNLIKHLARESLRYIPHGAYYALTGVLAVGRHVVRAYPGRVRVDRDPPLMKHFFAHETLFARSLEYYEAVTAPYMREFRWPLGRLYNGFFEAGDPELYYAMIRKHQPRLIIEVGSGHSTFFALDALRKNGCGRIVCIDPEPLREPPRGVEHIRARVEDVAPSVFDELAAGDILFIDSSHTTEECRYHVDHILPRLCSGVITHHHDVTYPYAIYYQGDRQAFGEPDVLLDYYAAHQDVYELLCSTSYARFRWPARWQALVRSYRWNPTRSPGSLWAKKIA